MPLPRHSPAPLDAARVLDRQPPLDWRRRPLLRTYRCRYINSHDDVALRHFEGLVLQAFETTGVTEASPTRNSNHNHTRTKQRVTKEGHCYGGNQWNCFRFLLSSCHSSMPHFTLVTETGNQDQRSTVAVVGRALVSPLAAWDHGRRDARSKSGPPVFMPFCQGGAIFF